MNEPLAVLLAPLLSAALLLAGPAATPLHAESLFVVCQSGAEISVIDLSAGAVAERIPVPKAPAGIAVSPDGGTAYVTHPDAGLLTRIDTTTRQVVDTTFIGGQPFAVVADPDGDTLYVSDWAGDAVHRLDGRTLARTGTVGVGRAPAGLALDAHRRRLYSADRESDAVSVIDIARFSRIASVPVGRAPYAFDAGNDPGFLAVANVRSGDIALIDKADHAVSRLPAGRMPYGLAVVPGTGRILVANQQSGTVSLLDPKTRRETASVRLGGSPESVVVSSDGQLAYVSEWFDDAVAVIDLDGLAVRARIRVGQGPRTMATVP